MNSFWNSSDESLLDILTNSAVRMEMFAEKYGTDNYQYQYQKAVYNDARAEVLRRMGVEVD